jgi:hypothetical protein
MSGLAEIGKDWLKHGPEGGFRLAYALLARTKAAKKAEALRLYRAGLTYLKGEGPDPARMKPCRIVSGSYPYTFFNICFVNDVLAASLDMLSKGMRPVIDIRHSETGENLWEQFFDQPFGALSEEELAGAAEIRYPEMAAFHPVFASVWDPEERRIWGRLYRDFFHFNKEAEAYIEEEYRTIFPKDGPVLGVLCRGTDYTGTKPKNHPIQPEVGEVIEKVRAGCPASGPWYLYLATDERQVEAQFREAFPGKVLVNKRSYYDQFYRPGEEVKVLGRVHLDRERDDYYRGLEYLSSLVLLSRCGSLIAGNCGGSNAAIYLNDEKYSGWYLFDKGVYE